MKFKLNTNLLLIDTQLIINMVQKIFLLIMNIKKINKLSIICNKNNFIHSVEVFVLKTKNDNYNDVVHDLKIVY